MIAFTIPIKAPSVANQRLHWAVKAKQTKSQRRAAMLKCPKWAGEPLLLITLTRHAQKELDTDNLAAALKGVRDGIAARLGIDDGSRLVAWEYNQEICPHGDESVGVFIVKNGEEFEANLVTGPINTTRIS